MVKEIIDISNTVSELELFSERERLMLQEVTEDFFDIDPSKKDGLFRIRCELDRHRIKNDIAMDYSYQISQELAKMNDFLSEILDRQKAEKENNGNIKALEHSHK